MRRMFGDQKGFSLVELMIVVGIIGILSTLAATRISSIGRVLKAKAQIASIANAIKIERAAQDKSLNMLAYGGPSCAACNCWGPPVGAAGADKSAGCKASMDELLQKIGMDGALMGPWGGYYWIDGNEDDWGACRRDTIGVWNEDDQVYIWSDIPAYDCEAPACAAPWSC